MRADHEQYALAFRLVQFILTKKTPEGLKRQQAVRGGVNATGWIQYQPFIRLLSVIRFRGWVGSSALLVIDP